MPATTPLRVLHIDKDKQFLEITQRILEMLGDFKVDTVQTISEANIALNQNSYDAIICAYYLDSLTGLEYYSQLRTKNNLTPIILFTIDNEAATEAQHKGVPFVTKYGDPEKVFSKLAELIRASKQ